jgi:EAL domain-containing protein (putative c-di-GMP-specific phosphodiesterase class I)
MLLLLWFSPTRQDAGQAVFMLQMKNHFGPALWQPVLFSSGRPGVEQRKVARHTTLLQEYLHAPRRQRRHDQHRERLKHTRFVCMNLSGASLNDEKFLQDVYDILEKNRHIVGQLCLEITESVALHDLDNTRTFVNKVRRIGARVALDDFGAGYTSFSYLKEITADLLKIDGSFIVNMNQHPANIAIVEAIVNLAKNLGMKVIAEWAEDNATVQTLMDIGVDYVQGFAVSRSQHPDKMLLATSSAGFIKDDELTLMMNQIGKPEPALNQVDLFSDAAGSRLH